MATFNDCSTSKQNTITDAYNGFINDDCLDCFPGLRASLVAKWGNITVDCTDPDCDDLFGKRSGNTIWICQNAFDDGTNRVAAVLLHELVHATGGGELDSEAVEHACFDGNGATLPTSGDWPKFFSETSSYKGSSSERKGKWVIWNANTGQVWGITEEGGISSGTDEVKGSLCFTESGFIDPTDGGGGGGGWV